MQHIGADDGVENTDLNYSMYKLTIDYKSSQYVLSSRNLRLAHSPLMQ